RRGSTHGGAFEWRKIKINPNRTPIGSWTLFLSADCRLLNTNKKKRDSGRARARTHNWRRNIINFGSSLRFLVCSWAARCGSDAKSVRASHSSTTTHTALE
uniref:Uncharacterized protein n=1 Tax=Anopheles atroparvus TaxID=41427 RepID=A0AAG5CPH9_ANOAO